MKKNKEYIIEKNRHYLVKKIRPYILCAAIWYDDKIVRHSLPRNVETGVVVGGHRHANCNSILLTMFPGRDYIVNNGACLLTEWKPVR